MKDSFQIGITRGAAAVRYTFRLKYIREWRPNPWVVQVQENGVQTMQLQFPSDFAARLYTGERGYVEEEHCKRCGRYRTDCSTMRLCTGKGLQS